MTESGARGGSFWRMAGRGGRVPGKFIAREAAACRGLSPVPGFRRSCALDAVPDRSARACRRHDTFAAPLRKVAPTGRRLATARTAEIVGDPVRPKSFMRTRSSLPEPGKGGRQGGEWRAAALAAQGIRGRAARLIHGRRRAGPAGRGNGTGRALGGIARGRRERSEWQATWKTARKFLS